MNSRRLILLLTFWLATACASTPSTTDDPSDEVTSAVEKTKFGRAVDTVTYTVDVSAADEGRVGVTVALDRPSAKSTVFGVEQSWGGLTNIPAYVDDVRAVNGSEEELEVSNVEKNRWKVTHPKGASVRFRYELTRDAEGVEPTPTRLMFAPRIEPERVFLIGPAMLAAPRIPVGDGGTLNVEFRWTGVPNGWRKITSHGTGMESGGEVRLDDLRHVVLYAGEEVRTLERTVGENSVYLAISGEWKFSDKRLADILSEIMAAERDFFGDHSQPYYAVTALPVDLSDTRYAGGSFTGGTGLYQSFAMFMVPDTPLETKKKLGLKHLLAHELFHNWNSPGLFDIQERKKEPEVYWFTEGFTEHFARLILRDADLITDRQFLNNLNEQLDAYRTNPLREISNAEVAEKFWESTNGRKLAYQRGAVIALMLDRKIRERTDGEESLADLMRHVYESEQSETKQPNVFLLEVIRQFAGADYAAKVRRYVLEGEPVELRGDALGPCYKLARTREEKPDWGFNVEKTVRKKVVHGVRADSPASDAGLSDGQKLHSIVKKSTDSGALLELTIATDVGNKTVTVQPDKKRVTTVAYRRRAESECD